MDNNKIATIMAQVREYIPHEKKMELQQRLSVMPDEAGMVISEVNFKSSTTTLILSIFLGDLGIDRFYVGDIGLGVLKLLTVGLFGVWGFIDIFLCYKKAKKKNYKALLECLNSFNN